MTATALSPACARSSSARPSGLPLDASIRLDGDVIELEGCKLRRLRYHAPVDAEARDYLVWEKP
ncbi:MAG TPA: hypothetical protein VIV58_35650, partial [Kofleriaceae bacterium]